MTQTVRLHFAVSSDFSPVMKDVQRVNDQILKLQAAGSFNVDQQGMQQVINKFHQLVTQTGTLQHRMMSVRTEADIFTENLSKGKLPLKDGLAALRSFRQEQGVLNQFTKEQLSLQRSVAYSLGKDSSGRAMGGIIREAKVSLDDAKMSARAFNHTLMATSNSVIDLGKNVQWQGRQMMVGMTIPLGIMGAAAGKAFLDMDKELTRIQKVYGSGFTFGEDFKRQSEAVRAEAKSLATEMAQSFGQSSITTLQLTADLAATGLEGQALQDSVKQTTKLALLGEVDRQEAMKTTLSLQTAFKMNTEELTEAINFMNAVENQTSASMQDLAAAIPRVGPVIKGLGGGIKETALFMTALREGGVDAGEGANALKSGLASIIAPTKEAQNYLQGFGVDIKGIVDRNKGELLPTILELQEALDGLGDHERQQVFAKLFGKYQMGKMGALFANLNKEGSQTATVIELMSHNTEDFAKLADQELNAITESAFGKFQIAIETFKDAMAGLGEEFVPMITKVIEFGTKALEWFQSLGEGTKALIKWSVLLAALIGPAVMLGGILMNFVGTISRIGTTIGSLFVGKLQIATEEMQVAKAIASELSIPFENLGNSVDGMVSSMQKFVNLIALANKTAANGAKINGAIAVDEMAALGFLGGQRKYTNTRGAFVASRGSNNQSSVQQGQIRPGETRYVPKETSWSLSNFRAIIGNQTPAGTFEGEERIKRLAMQMDLNRAFVGGEFTAVMKDYFPDPGQRKKAPDQSDLMKHFDVLTNPSESAAAKQSALNSLQSSELFQRVAQRYESVFGHLSNNVQERAQQLQRIADRLYAEANIFTNTGGQKGLGGRMNVVAAATSDQVSVVSDSTGRGDVVAKSQLYENDVFSVAGVAPGVQPGVSEHLLANNIIKNYTTAQEYLRALAEQYGTTTDGLMDALRARGFSDPESLISGVSEKAKELAEIDERIAQLPEDAMKNALANARVNLAAAEGDPNRVGVVRERKGKFAFSGIDTASALSKQLNSMITQEYGANISLDQFKKEAGDLDLKMEQYLKKIIADNENAADAASKKLVQQARDTLKTMNQTVVGPKKTIAKVEADQAELASLKQQRDIVLEQVRQSDQQISQAMAQTSGSLSSIAQSNEEAAKILEVDNEKLRQQEAEAKRSARQAKRRKIGGFVGTASIGLGSISMITGQAQGTDAKATAINAANMAGMGAGAGMMFGPWGAAIGAAAGAGLGVIQKLNEAADKLSQAVVDAANNFRKATTVSDDLVKVLAGENAFNKMAEETAKKQEELSSKFFTIGKESSKMTKSYIDQFGADQIEALKSLDDNRAMNAVETLFLKLVQGGVPTEIARQYVSEIANRAGKQHIPLRIDFGNLGLNSGDLSRQLSRVSQTINSMLGDSVGNLKAGQVSEAYTQAGTEAGELFARALQIKLENGAVDPTQLSQIMTDSYQSALKGFQLESGNEWQWSDLVSNKLYGSLDQEVMRAQLGLPSDASVDEIKNAYLSKSDSVRAEIQSKVSDEMKDSLKGLEVGSDAFLKQVLTSLPPDIAAVAQQIDSLSDSISLYTATMVATGYAYANEDVGGNGIRKTLEDAAKAGQDLNDVIGEIEKIDPKFASAFSSMTGSIANDLREVEGLDTTIDIDGAALRIARLQAQGLYNDLSQLEGKDSYQIDIIIKTWELEATMRAADKWLITSAEVAASKAEAINSEINEIQENTQDATDQMQKDNKAAEDAAKKASGARIKAAEKANKAEEDAAKKALDAYLKQIQAENKAREKARKQEQKNLKEFYDNQIKSIKDAEDARQKAFEEEEKRQRRAKEYRDLQLKMAEGVATGDAFAVLSAQMEMGSLQSGWQAEDAEEAAQAAFEERIRLLEEEKDLRLEELQLMHEEAARLDQERLEREREMGQQRLEMIREQNQAELEALREREDAKLEAMRAAGEKAVTDRQAEGDRLVANKQAEVDKVTAAEQYGTVKASELLTQYQTIYAAKIQQGMDETQAHNAAIDELGRIHAKSKEEIVAGLQKIMSDAGASSEAILRAVNNAVLFSQLMSAVANGDNQKVAELSMQFEISSGGKVSSAAKPSQNWIQSLFGRLIGLDDWGSADNKRASGGYITGPGTGTSDDIPAMLSNGEYVIRAAAVSRYGKSFFDGLNAEKYADGGIVGGAPSTFGVIAAQVSTTGEPETPLIGSISAVEQARLQADAAAALSDQELHNQKTKNVTDILNTTLLANKTITQSTNDLLAVQQKAAEQNFNTNSVLSSQFVAESLAGNARMILANQQRYNDFYQNNVKMVNDTAWGTSNMSSQWAGWRNTAQSDIKAVGNELIDSFTGIDYGAITRFVELAANGDAAGAEAEKRKIVRRAYGGYVSGPGTATSDSIPARLSNGEFVIRQRAVQKYGVSTFKQMNEGRFATGGLVGAVTQKASDNLNSSIQKRVQAAIDAKYATKLAAAGDYESLTPEQMAALKLKSLEDIGQTHAVTTAMKNTNGRFYNGSGSPHRVGWAGQPFWGVNDIGTGGMPVFAYADGTVVFADNSSSYKPGFIDIRHRNGGQTRYAHIPRSQQYVSAGDQVKAGQRIATSGTDHLHFEWKGMPSLTQRGSGEQAAWFALGGMVNAAVIKNMFKSGKAGLNPDSWKINYPAAIDSTSSASIGDPAAFFNAGSNGGNIWKWLIAQGLTPEGAAGVMGNLYEESGFNPGAGEKGGTGRGIVQWSFGRADNLRKFAAERNKPWNDLATQLDFLMHEISGNKTWTKMWNQLKTIKDVGAATALFHDTFEKSNDRNRGIYHEREDSARKIYSSYSSMGQVPMLANGGLVIPALRKGATINYDNTLANLHRGETVLTAPLTDRLKDNLELASGGEMNYTVNVNINKANANVSEIETAVYRALDKKERKIGRSRVVGRS